MPAISSENREALAGFDLLWGGFQRACVAAGGTLDRFFKIGEFTLCLRFAGNGLLPYISAALAHLSMPPTAAPDLTICLWDTVSTNTPLAPLLYWLCKSMRAQPFDLLSPRQEIRVLSNARVPATFEMGAGVLSMLDTEQDLALYWVHDAAQLPYYEQGAPLRTILNWWLSRRNLQCVHAGAVGTAAGGVLLTGKGGSGKSTTALACLAADLFYVSDDYCLLANEPTPYVYSLYNTAKLNGLRDLQRQPQFLPMIHNADRLGQEKLLMFLADHLPQKLQLGFPLKAILLPCVTDKIETTLRPVSGGQALKALAPTSMFQLPGAAQRAFQNMGKVVRQLPCYQLEVGSDLRTIPATILQLLAVGGPSGD